MGSYNYAPIADLIGIYILDTLDRIIDRKQVGLYKDDGLIFISESNAPQNSKIHEKIIRAFKLLGLIIEISSNLKIFNFLEIILNLMNNAFRLFSKVNIYLH